MVEGVMHAASGHHFLDELDAVVLLFPLFCVCSPLVKHASKLLVFLHCDSVVYDPPEVGLVAMIECPCSDDSFLLVQLELSLDYKPLEIRFSRGLPELKHEQTLALVNEKLIPIRSRE